MNLGKISSGTDGLHLKAGCYATKLALNICRKRWYCGLSCLVIHQRTTHLTTLPRFEIRSSSGSRQNPTVCGLSCGEIWMRLMSQCNLDQTKGQATVDYSGVQLCAGLKPRIKGNLHALCAIWSHSTGWEYDYDEDEAGTESTQPSATQEATQEAEPPADRNLRSNIRLAVDPGTDEDISRSRYKADTVFGAGLFDAQNALGELNRYRMMHTVVHRWNKGSMFAMNRYQLFGIVYVRDEPGKLHIILHCNEGIPQGYGLFMFSYGVGLIPLSENIQIEVPESL